MVTIKVGSINSHGLSFTTAGHYLLSFFRLFLFHFVSLIGRVARYTPSSTYKLKAKIARKSDKVN